MKEEIALNEQFLLSPQWFSKVVASKGVRKRLREESRRQQQRRLKASARGKSSLAKTLEGVFEMKVVASKGVRRRLREESRRQ